ncbi:hypothetical protein JWJ90_20655 [Desulfobulbus rhabdoformis]|uniref:hypothetical protein n=1 Tax=Desulfobulbus rhabdoformis TaxID=34032 RepID=UPI001965D692|nr:hypothetical protein [Desulfobulbus rhabdoformis]MBM9616679.1 hypothetical protein [Desulfobulbus rhabdoformis]
MARASPGTSAGIFQVCKDKAAGDKVSLKTPHGDTIEAVCETNNNRLVAHPLNPPPQHTKRR